MEITGKVINILPEQSGQSANGTWRKRQFVLEIPGNYPKKVCIMMWGDKIDQFQLQEGSEVTAYIDIESREYNGRWYTDVKAWKIENKGATQQPMGDVPPPPTQEMMQQPAATDDPGDLPF